MFLTCNTIQYNTIQYNTIQYNTIQYNTIQYDTRGAKQGGLGGISTPPEFGMGGLNTCQPPLILRKKILRGGWLPLN